MAVRFAVISLTAGYAQAAAHRPDEETLSGAQWVTPGLLASVCFRKGEETLRHASVREWWKE